MQPCWPLWRIDQKSSCEGREDKGISLDYKIVHWDTFYWAGSKKGKRPGVGKTNDGNPGKGVGIEET